MARAVTRGLMVMWSCVAFAGSGEYFDLFSLCRAAALGPYRSGCRGRRSAKSSAAMTAPGSGACCVRPLFGGGAWAFGDRLWLGCRLVCGWARTMLCTTNRAQGRRRSVPVCHDSPGSSARRFPTSPPLLTCDRWVVSFTIGRDRRGGWPFRPFPVAAELERPLVQGSEH